MHWLRHWVVQKQQQPTILFANLKNVYKENRIKIDQAQNYSEYKAKQTSLFIMERW